MGRAGLQASTQTANLSFGDSAKNRGLCVPQPMNDDGASWTQAASELYAKTPKCLAAIGLVAATWTQVENGLADLISGALGPANKGDDEGRSWGITTNWIAHAAFREAETIRVRIKIADATYGVLIKGSSLEASWNKIKDRLNKRSRTRNRIVHSTYGWSPDYPDAMLRIPADGAIEVWKLADFEGAASQMRELYLELHEMLLATLRAIDSKEIDNAITQQIDRLRPS